MFRDVIRWPARRRTGGEYDTDDGQGDGHDGRASFRGPGLSRLPPLGPERQTRVPGPVTSAKTPSPAAKTLRLWSCRPVITETAPESSPKTTENTTSRGAAVTAAWRPVSLCASLPAAM